VIDRSFPRPFDESRLFLGDARRLKVLTVDTVTDLQSVYPHCCLSFYVLCYQLIIIIKIIMIIIITN